MDCETARFLIEALHDDELDAGEAAALLAHLDACEPCRAASRRTEALREACRRVAEDRCPDELRTRLARLCSEVSSRSGQTSAPAPRKRSSRRALVVTSVATVATGIGFGLGFGAFWWRTSLRDPGVAAGSRASGQGAPLPYRWAGATSLSPSSEAEKAVTGTLEGEVFCLRCALENLMPDTAFSGMDHRAVLRTPDGQLWTIASGADRLGGSQPSCSGRRVVVTARLHPRFASLDVLSCRAEPQTRAAAMVRSLSPVSGALGGPRRRDR